MWFLLLLACGLSQLAKIGYRSVLRKLNTAASWQLTLEASKSRLAVECARPLHVESQLLKISFLTVAEQSSA